MIATFVKKPLAVQAVRWELTNIVECKNLLGSSFIGQNHIQGSSNLSNILIRGYPTNPIAEKGDWIVKFPGGVCRVFSHKDFNNMFFPEGWATPLQELKSKINSALSLDPKFVFEAVDQAIFTERLLFGFTRLPKYYSAPCRIFRSTPGGVDEVVTCPEDEAEFWTVYERDENGLSQALADFDNPEAALVVLDKLLRLEQLEK